MPRLIPAASSRAFALLVALAGCSASEGTAGTTTRTTTTTTDTVSSGAQPGAARADGGAMAAEVMADDTRALLTQVLSEQMCPKLTGSYVGLPGEGNATGPAAGQLPSAGRWWIRTCTASVANGHVALHIAGPGWTWIDREASGFRVQQYVLFDADVSLGADVTVGYEPTSRIASIWMTPEGGVQARVQPVGVVHAEPTGFFATMLGGIATVAGATPSQRATAQASDLGATQMRTRLAAGFTMTYALTNHQIDFMVGRLDRGQTPERPFGGDPSQSWLVNARSEVYPGGVDVIGPVDASTQPLVLEIAVEEGAGVSLRTACASDLGHYFDARFRAPDQAAAAPPGQTLATLTDTQLHRVAIAQTACPVALVVAPVAGTTLPVKLRYRVVPAVVTPGGVASAAAAPSQMRVTVVSVDVSPHNPSGHDWDMIGGDADPYVIVASVPRGRELGRTQTIANHNSATFNHVLPGVVSTATDFPLRVSVMDADETSDELVGTADVDARALSGGATDVSIPVRSAGSVPVQTGVVRLHVDPAQ